jgi:mannose-6-phosphate isomerase-like protein (cupin superfamily)
MRRTLFLSAIAIGTSATVFAQTTPPVRATAKPATLTVQVTDTLGAPLADATVTVTGPVIREGNTAPDGSLRLTNMRAGSYRLRFVREGSIMLERDITLRAGESPTVDIALSAAPIAAPAVAPNAPNAPNSPNAPNAPSELGPPGDPKVTPVPLFLEKNFIGGREARKDSQLGCTATGTATLHQLRDAWLSHTHDTAEEWIYVVAGEGTLRIGTTEQRVQAGTFSLVPHTMTHALIPQGRNPLIVISVLSGPRCQG